MSTPPFIGHISEENRILFRELAKKDKSFNSSNVDSGSPFSQILTDAVNSAGTCQVSSENSASLDKNQIELMLKRIELKMNSQLLRMISGDREENSSDLFEGLAGLFPGQGSNMIVHEDASPSSTKERKPDPPSLNGNYDAMIKKASETYGVDAELIKSVIKVESNFNAKSTSPKGAMGLMQLMPATARDLGVKNSYNPEENIMAGTRYLKGLLNRYHGNVRLALAAYNWGMGNVEKNPGKMPLETRNYVARVTANYSRETEV